MNDTGIRLSNNMSKYTPLSVTGQLTGYVSPTPYQFVRLFDVKSDVLLFALALYRGWERFEKFYGIKVFYRHLCPNSWYTKEL